METIANTQARLETFIKDYCTLPGVNLLIDISPGSVLSELLMKLSAQLHSQIKLDSDSIAAAPAVQAALAATGDTYSEAIDAVASNFNAVRDEGLQVAGKVKMTVAYDRVYYIDSAFQLIAPSLGMTYQVTQAFRVESGVETDNAASGELKLFKEGTAGPYYFLLPVTSLDLTSNVSAPHGAAMDLNSATTTLDGFVSASAFGNFSSGRAQETDRQLIARFQAGLSLRGLSSPQSMQALLPEEFPELFTQGVNRNAILSIVGANDPELNRGRNSTFGISQFGLADVYLRTSKTVEVGWFPAVAECTKAKDSTSAEWAVTLDSSLLSFPTWFYDLISVSYINDAGVELAATQTDTLEFSADADAANQLGGGNIVAAEVARFTHYQVCVATVTLTGVAGDVPAVGTTHAVSVLISYMPSIGEIQEYLLQSGHRLVGTDYLVKAVIPCSVSMRLNLVRASSQAVDVLGIKQGIFDYINNLSFGDTVAVSKIIDICHNFAVRRVNLPVVLTGTILLPSLTAGETRVMTSSDVLSVPYDAELLKKGLSSKTTMFFVNHQDVSGQNNIDIAV